MVTEWVKKFVEKHEVYRLDDSDPTFLSQDELYGLRNEKLHNQIKLAAQYSPYYKEKFKTEGINPEDIKTLEDLEKLPLTYKKDYMVDPMAFRLAFDEPSLYHILYDMTYTTGTTSGIPSPFFNTSHDYFGLYLNGMRTIKTFCNGEERGLTPDDVFVNLFPIAPVPHIGFFRVRDGATATGIKHISPCVGSPYPEFPFHKSTEYAVNMIEKQKGTALAGIASYVRRVIMKAEEMGKDFSSVWFVAALGEACPKAMRDDLRERLGRLGAKNAHINNCIGFTENQFGLWECKEFGGCHNSAPDLYYFEVVDEKTGKCVPPGEKGLLTITHLNRRGTVLLRYVLGDICALSYDTCPHCGRNGERIIISAGSAYAVRTSELVKLKGTLINPEILRDQVASVKGVEEWQIVFDKSDPDDPFSMDVLKVRLCARGDRPNKEIEEEMIKRALNTVEMKPQVEFVNDVTDIYNLESGDFKAIRIVDKRKTE